MFPKSFYRESEGSQWALLRTSSPPGELKNPTDLLNSTHPWVTVIPNAELKEPQKKDLVFADYLYAERDDYEKAKILSSLEQARDEGFIIYLMSEAGMLEEWDGNPPPPAYSPDLNFLSIDSIRSKAYQQYRLVADRLFILDYFGINELLGRPANALSWELAPLGKVSKLVEIISASPRNSYELSFASSEDVSLFFSLADELAPSLDKFKIIKIASKKIGSLQLNNLLLLLPRIEEIELGLANHGEGFNLFFSLGLLNKLSQLKNVSLANYKFTTVGLYSLFMAFPYLEKIRLIHCELANEPFERTGLIQLAHLKEIDLHSTEVKASEVSSLFEACPQLEKINLGLCNLTPSGCKSIKGSFKGLTFNQLRQLKAIYLNNTDVDAEEAAILLSAAPNLEVIGFSNCKNIEGSFTRLSESQLKKLKVINLDCASINNKDLEYLLKAAPHLEEISLASPGKLIGLLNQLILTRLKHLKGIGLSRTDVKTGEVSALFKAWPQLEIIDLSFCKSIKGSFNGLAFAQLRRLKVINLNESDIDIDDLINLIKAASRLERIGVNKCRGIKHLLNLPLSELEHLKELKGIDLGNTDAGAEEVATLLKVAPHLENVNFSGCRNMKGSFKNLASSQLRELKEVNLDETDIDCEDVEALLKAAPHLRAISLNRCANIKHAFKASSPFSLKNLKLISLVSSDIDDEDANAILAAAPQLEHINFELCNNLSGFWPTLSLSQARHIKSAKTDSNQWLVCDGKSFMPAFTDRNGSIQIGHRDISRQPSEIAEDPDEKESNQSAVKVSVLDRSCSSNPPLPLEPQPLTSDFFKTVEDKPTLACSRYFPGVDPQKYRLFHWKPDLDSKVLERAPIKPSDFKEIKLEEVYLHPDYKSELGIRPADFMEGRRIILPSLDTEEKLHGVQVVYEGETEPVDLSQIRCEYSASTGFHRVILPRAGRCTITYQVAFPQAKPALPQEIAELVSCYKEHEPEKASPNKNFSTLREFANYIKTNKTGNCEQLSLAFYAELEAQYPGKLRITCNQVHAVIEMELDGRWHRIDLGGYDAILKEEALPLPKLEKAAKKSPSKVLRQSPLPAFTDEEKESVSEFEQKLEDKNKIPQPQAVSSQVSCDEKKSFSPQDLEDKREEVPSQSLRVKPRAELIPIPSDEACRWLYERLTQEHQHHPADIFIAHSPGELNLQGSGLTKEGEFKSSYTPFSRWFQGRQKGLIVVDARYVETGELAQLNDLLDGKTLDNYPIPEGMQILIIDRSDRGYYGPDFKRRVTINPPLADFPSRPLLKEALPNLSSQASLPDEKIAVGTRIEIDLFNSLYWDCLLLGSWKLKLKGDQSAFSFEWRSGELVKLFSSPETTSPPQEVIFKNPPLHDKTFTTFLAELQSLGRLKWADQTSELPPGLVFSQSKGYDWPLLSSQASVATLTTADRPYTLSDANILSFIDDPACGFSKENDQLQPKPAYLAQSKKAGIIDVICAYGLSQSTLAQFLTAAHKEGIRVRFLTPDKQDLPKNSPLSCLVWEQEEKQELVEEKRAWESPLVWQLHEDVYFATRKMLGQYPEAAYCDLSSLEASELGRQPDFPEELRRQFLEKGRLSLSAPLSDLLILLKAGKTVILSGKVPPSLYEALTSLSLGLIEGEPYTGKLILLTPPEEEALAKALTGKTLIPQAAEDKTALLSTLYPELKTADEAASFAILERHTLQAELKTQYEPLTPRLAAAKTDQEKAQAVDDHRLAEVKKALALSPWAMIEGLTGIGKTYFLKKVLPTAATTFDDLEEWLRAKPGSDEQAILVVDEANFLSYLSGKGENFLERFKSLRTQPPSFLWKGKYQTLSSQHKVVFAFNPASYGGGRHTEGFLREQAIAVHFKPLPDFYVRERVLKPILGRVLDSQVHDFRSIEDPLLAVYQWLVKHSDHDANEVLITPREITAMANLIAYRVKRDNIHDAATLGRLALEVAYKIGRQILAGPKVARLADFDAAFPPSQSVINRQKSLPASFLPHQQEVYHFIQDWLGARGLLSKDHSDLGLSAFFLEGGSNIGKTCFLAQIEAECKVQGKVSYRISPSLPPHDKEAILDKAFAEGGLIFAEEFNASLWPNKLLNSYLSGFDKDGKPAEKPGFALVATQNPPSYEGRYPEDPAIRKRSFKFELNWPVYAEAKLAYEEALDIASQLTAAILNPLSIEKSRLEQGPQTPNRQARREAFTQAINKIEGILTDYRQQGGKKEVCKDQIVKCLEDLKNNKAIVKYGYYKNLIRSLLNKVIALFNSIAPTACRINYFFKPEGKSKDLAIKLCETIPSLSLASKRK